MNVKVPEGVNLNTWVQIASLFIILAGGFSAWNRVTNANDRQDAWIAKREEEIKEADAELKRMDARLDASERALDRSADRLSTVEARGSAADGILRDMQKELSLTSTNVSVIMEIIRRNEGGDDATKR